LAGFGEKKSTLDSNFVFYPSGDDNLSNSMVALQSNILYLHAFREKARINCLRMG
jgi:hypothetical protein